MGHTAGLSFVSVAVLVVDDDRGCTLGVPFVGFLF